MTFNVGVLKSGIIDDPKTFIQIQWYSQKGILYDEKVVKRITEGYDRVEGLRRIDNILIIFEKIHSRINMLYSFDKEAWEYIFYFIWLYYLMN